MKDVLAKPFPTEIEFIFLLFLVAIVTPFVTWIDIIIHDGYVKPIISECPPENQSEFCQEQRLNLTGSLTSRQLELGDPYWNILLSIPIVTGFLLGITRIGLGKMAGAKTNPMIFIIGFLWFFSVISLYYTGWLDYLYYALRGIDIPDTPLDWLDGVGLFRLVQGFGPTQSVDAIDLYLLMGIGLVLLIGVWSFMIHHHKKRTWHKLKLI